MTQAFSLTQTQKQKQVILPQMVQTAKFLQATTQELGQILQSEMLQNPVLEVVRGNELLIGNPIEESVARRDDENERIIEAVEKDENLLDLGKYKDSSDERSDFDYWDNDREKHRQFMFDSMETPRSLKSNLLEQLNETVDEDKQGELYKACTEVLGNIDDNGYLLATDEEIAAGAAIDLDTARKAVEIVQGFVPAGIGGHDLREVLLLQLKRNREYATLAWDIVDKHLDELARNKLPQIAKAIDADLNEVEEALSRIRQLDPQPGSRFSEEIPPAVLPEAEIRTDEKGNLIVELTKDAFPQIAISSKYLEMLDSKKLSKEDRSYLMQKISDANALKSCLSYRESTIERITMKILEYQLDFFVRGTNFLKPMTLKDIAEALDLDETTISRALANKYLRTKYGVFPYKYFFTSGFESADGTDVSNRTVRQKIVDIIKKENPEKPLSDQKISEMLAKDGLDVARRTVAKYREAEGIQATSLRKKHI